MSLYSAYIQYLEYINSRLKAQTKYTIKERFERNILPILGEKNIYEFSEKDYISFQNFLESKNYSYNYKKGIHNVLSAFFEYCVKFLDVDKNVVRIVGCSRNLDFRKERDFYTYKDFKKFIRFVDNFEDVLFFEFLYFTGCRPGETMALQFRDFNKGFIYITKTISEHCIDGKRVINSPKTNSSNRKIKLDIFLQIKLLRLKRYYLKKYGYFSEDFYVFGGLKPFAVTTINRHKENACKKARLRSIDLHEFRHSHASLLFSRGVSVKAIQNRLGHSNANITLNTYIHSNNKVDEKRVLSTLIFLRFKI